MVWKSENKRFKTCPKFDKILLWWDHKLRLWLLRFHFQWRRFAANFFKNNFVVLFCPNLPHFVFLVSASVYFILIFVQIWNFQNGWNPEIWWFSGILLFCLGENGFESGFNLDDFDSYPLISRDQFWYWIPDSFPFEEKTRKRSTSDICEDEVKNEKWLKFSFDVKITKN